MNLPSFSRCAYGSTMKNTDKAKYVTAVGVNGVMGGNPTCRCNAQMKYPAITRERTGRKCALKHQSAFEHTSAFSGSGDFGMAHRTSFPIGLLDELATRRPASPTQQSRTSSTVIFQTAPVSRNREPADCLRGLNIEQLSRDIHPGSGGSLPPSEAPDRGQRPVSGHGAARERVAIVLAGHRCGPTPSVLATCSVYNRRGTDGVGGEDRGAARAARGGGGRRDRACGAVAGGRGAPAGGELTADPGRRGKRPAVFPT